MSPALKSSTTVSAATLYSAPGGLGAHVALREVLQLSFAQSGGLGDGSDPSVVGCQLFKVPAPKADIGRAHNIALSTLPGLTLPGDVSASKRYWAQDLIDPPVQVSPQGTIAVSTAAGLGYGLDQERIESLTERHQDLY